MGDVAPVTVVGAGVAGLTAALELARAGRAVAVVDKGARVGGRLGTRHLAGAVVDSGAQFFTVRSDELAARVERWVADGLVFEWCRGFGDSPDGHPRYAVNGGFRQLAEAIATEARAAGATITCGVELSSVDAAGGPVVLTPPAPQAVALLAAAGIEVDPSVARLAYTPTTSLHLVLDGPSAVPLPGGRQLTEGPFTFVADNATKGISERPALTLHTTKKADADVDELVEDAGPWIGGAGVVGVDLERWRYAQPVDPHPDRYVVVGGAAHPIVLAGDAYGGAKVEGALLSGLAAAAAVLEAGR